MANINDVLKDHGIGSGGSGGSKQKVEELRKQIANLTSIADIYNRASGAQDVMYDLFDGTNDKSCGQIDLAITKPMGALPSGKKIVPVEKLAYIDAYKKSHQFKKGQEVTIQDSTNKETKILEAAEITNALIPTDFSTPFPLVSGSVFQTMGNGGRKIVRLSNGWFVIALFDTSLNQIRFFISKDNFKTTPMPLTYIAWSAAHKDISIVSKGTRIYIVAIMSSGSVAVYCTFDALTVTNTSQTYVNIDTNQSAFEACSLAINSAGTELHACWSCKNTSYNLSFNIRYAKGTINADGSVTWVSAINLTTQNTTNYNISYPSIICDINDKPHIICNFSFINNAEYIIDITTAFTTKDTLQSYSNVLWGVKTIFNGGVDPQLNPSTIFVPQSINGLVSGRMWTTWYGRRTGFDTSIGVSYSDDSGVSWSAVQWLGSETNYPQSNPSITVNKRNEIFILWDGCNAAFPNVHLRKISYKNNTWSSIQEMSTNAVGNNANYYTWPSTLIDFDMPWDEPIVIYKDYYNTRVLLAGKYDFPTIAPVLTFTEPLINNYSNDVMIYRSNVIIKDNKLKMGRCSYKTLIDRSAVRSINAVLGTTQFNNSDKIAMDSKGYLYAVYTYGSVIYCVRSTDDGVTWTDLALPIISGYTQQAPSIAIDKNDNVHVVWAGVDPTYPSYPQIKYCKFNGTAWSSYINISPIAGNYTQSTPAIAIDSKNNIHVVWAGPGPTDGYNSIKYTKFNGTAWETWSYLTTLTGYHQQYPCIAVDDFDNLHVVWSGTDSKYTGVYQIKYSKFDGKSWSTYVNIAPVDGYTQQYPSIVIDKNNNIHVVWSGADSVSTSYAQIKYTKFNGSTWNVWVNVYVDSNYSHLYPSIAVDDDNIVHVVWQCNASSYYRIKYTKFDGLSWSSTIDLSPTTSTGHQQFVACVKNFRDFNEPLVIWYDAVYSVTRFRGKWYKTQYNNIKEVDVRYNITPPADTTNEVVAWIEYENENIPINFDVSIEEVS